MVLENVIFPVWVYSPMWRCSPSQYWSVIILYRCESIRKITEAYTTIPISIIAMEEKRNMIFRHNKSNVAKPISEFIKTQKATFSSVKHSECIASVEVRFYNNVVSWVFYVALDLNSFCQEKEYLRYWFSLECSFKSGVLALMRLRHVLKWFWINVLLADLLERLRVDWYVTFLRRHQALAW